MRLNLPYWSFLICLTAVRVFAQDGSNCEVFDTSVADGNEARVLNSDFLIKRYAPKYVFDGEANTEWFSRLNVEKAAEGDDPRSFSVGYDFVSQKRATHYAIHYSAHYESASPLQFELQGANANGEWFVLDRRQGQKFWLVEPLRRFKIASANYYQKYRLVVHRSNDGKASAERIRIADFLLMNCYSKSNPKPSSSASGSSSSASTGSASGSTSSGSTSNGSTSSGGSSSGAASSSASSSSGFPGGLNGLLPYNIYGTWALQRSRPNSAGQIRETYRVAGASTDPSAFDRLFTIKQDNSVVIYIKNDRGVVSKMVGTAGAANGDITIRVSGVEGPLLGQNFYYSYLITSINVSYLRMTRDQTATF